MLDLDPKLASQYHNDRHVVKMILETAQILCTTHHELGNHDVPYRATHKSHPCTIWARKSLDNYNWLKKLGINLSLEYTFRFGKIHKSQEVIENLPVPKLDQNGLTEFALAMPEEYRVRNDPVLSYRMYYKKSKNHLASWKKRGEPHWWANLN